MKFRQWSTENIVISPEDTELKIEFIFDHLNGFCLPPTLKTNFISKVASILRQKLSRQVHSDEIKRKV